MNVFPILLLGGAAALIMTKKKPAKAVTNGGGTAAGGDAPAPGEPAIGDTVAASTSPLKGVMWKVVRSPDGYQARWNDIREPGVWQSAGDFDTPAEARQNIIDQIGLGQIP